MIFEKYDPLKKQIFQVMDEKGKIINPEYMKKLSDEQLLQAYKIMNLSRIQDKKQSQWQRQGRLLSFLTSTGQEACEVGYALNLKRGVDWFAPAYRNNAALLTAGVPMRNIMLYWCGNEKGMLMPEDVKVLPINIPIGTQYSHAAGLAFAEKYKNGKGIVITTIGDVTADKMLAHVASAQAIVAVDNILGKNETLNYDKIPGCIYSFPEAAVGLTEQQCKDQKLDYKVFKFPLSVNGKAIADGETQGFVKLISQQPYGKIIGAHIIAATATDMISEITTVMELEGTVYELAKSIHPHPTLSEVIMEAAHGVLNKPINL